jgi:CBS domain-containing protein
MTKTRVREVMTAPVQSCSPDDALNVPAKMMWDGDLGSVPVVDAERRVIAMITDRDIAMAGYTTGRPLPELQVHSAMSKRVFVCHPDDTLGDAEAVMRTARVRRLPVLDDEGRLVGILSLADLARHYAPPLPGDAGQHEDGTWRMLSALSRQEQRELPVLFSNPRITVRRAPSRTRRPRTAERPVIQS